MPAVRTTIVGGRPPGCGKGIGEIPRGIEVLVKKASVDAEFRALLLERRAEAASEIGLELDPAEAAILNGLPREQLEAIIARTRVRPEHRAAFAGRNVLLMLAALGVATSSCDRAGPVRGIEPDGPEGDLPAVEQPAEPAQRPVSMGIRPPRCFRRTRPSGPQPRRTRRTSQLLRLRSCGARDRIGQPPRASARIVPSAGRYRRCRPTSRWST